MSTQTAASPRRASVRRVTRETTVDASVALDGTGASEIATGIGFLDHMIDQIARHGLFDLTVKAEGDLHIDFHHTTEDVGITLGQAFAKALGDRKGITRFADATVPLDEALSRAVVDVSGRPGLVWRVDFTRDKIGEMDTELFREFFAGFAGAAGLTVHAETFYGENNHHKIESLFKAFARALRGAVEIDPRRGDAVPSTKGTLGDSLEA
jgi:imidazoleglycerol-phosphate dehydratase